MNVEQINLHLEKTQEVAGIILRRLEDFIKALASLGAASGLRPSDYARLADLTECRFAVQHIEGILLGRGGEKVILTTGPVSVEASEPSPRCSVSFADAELFAYPDTEHSSSRCRLVYVDMIQSDLTVRFIGDTEIDVIDVKCDVGVSSVTHEALVILKMLSSHWVAVGGEFATGASPARVWSQQQQRQATLGFALNIAAFRATAVVPDVLAREGHLGDVLLRVSVLDTNTNVSGTMDASHIAGVAVTTCSAHINAVTLEQEVSDRCDTCIHVSSVDITLSPNVEREPRSNLIGPPVIDVQLIHGTWNPLLMRSFGTVVGLIMAEIGPSSSTDSSLAGASVLNPSISQRAAEQLTDAAVHRMLSFDEEELRSLLRGSLAVLRVKKLTVDIPFKLWNTADEALLEMFVGVTNEAVTRDVNRPIAIWDCISVEVIGVTLVVQEHDSSTHLPPNILLHLRDVEVLSTGLNEWSHVPARNSNGGGGGAAGNAIRRYIDGATGRRLENLDAASDELRARPLQRFFCTDAFAMESFGDQVIELFLAHVYARWSQAAQLRIFKAVRDVTFNIWDTLLTARMLKFASDPELVLSFPLDNSAAFKDCVSRFKAGLLGSGGNKLHRMYAHGIHLEVSFSGSSDDLVELDVELLKGIDLPEAWDIRGVGIKLEGHPTAMVEHMSIRHTLDNRADVVVGAPLKKSMQDHSRADKMPAPGSEEARKEFP